jgi:hypothetical protein
MVEMMPMPPSVCRVSGSVSAVLVLVLLAGCGGANSVGSSGAPTLAEAGDKHQTCTVAKDPLNPLIVEWPGTSKVDLDTASRSGVVVVSYAGCALKVLTNCRAPGSYEFTAVTPAREHVQIDTTQDLYANLPLGVASLKGELSQGVRLELNYVAVGQRLNQKPVTTLDGQCAGATHYVRTITVGAYGLDAIGTQKVGAGAEYMGVGANVSSSGSRRNLRASGNLDACIGGASAAPDPQACSAILQLGLTPLPEALGGASTQLAPERPASSGSSTAGILLSAGGALSLVGTGVFAFLNYQNNQKLDNGDFSTASDIKKANDNGKIYNVGLVTTAVLGVGLLAVGIPVWILSGRKQESASSRTTLYASPGGLVFGTRF